MTAPACPACHGDGWLVVRPVCQCTDPRANCNCLQPCPACDGGAS